MDKLQYQGNIYYCICRSCMCLCCCTMKSKVISEGSVSKGEKKTSRLCVSIYEGSIWS
jgi:hypothetical protein